MEQAGKLTQKLRCAVYTRKSSEEGLDMEFNSLDAQRESCEAYVASQKAEGWLLVSDRYDDGGYSGGTLDRPALQRLLADIQSERIDIVVVYKIDRLSRSLMDFAKLVEVFNNFGVTFVSVTQQFNTLTSMGRLTLNMLLSFAQFEREVIGERIRDKFAASRKRGIWMGGVVPLGYEVKDRKLVVRDDEAALVRSVFERFAKLGSTTLLTRQLIEEGTRSRRGRPINKGTLYKLLINRVYIGEAVHKGVAYPGEHQPIVSRELWDNVQAIMRENPRVRAGKVRAATPALLRGVIFDSTGRAMSPSHTRRRGRRYSYYVSQTLLKGTADRCSIGRVPAGEVEAAVIDQVRQLLQVPEIVAATARALSKQAPEIDEEAVRQTLKNFDSLWDVLFPVEQARVVRLLVERVDVKAAGLDITLRTPGLAGFVADIRALPSEELAA